MEKELLDSLHDIRESLSELNQKLNQYIVSNRCELTREELDQLSKISSRHLLDFFKINQKLNSELQTLKVSQALKQRRELLELKRKSELEKIEIEPLIDPDFIRNHIEITNGFYDFASYDSIYNLYRKSSNEKLNKREFVRRLRVMLNYFGLVDQISIHGSIRYLKRVDGRKLRGIYGILLKSEPTQKVV